MPRLTQAAPESVVTTIGALTSPLRARQGYSKQIIAAKAILKKEEMINNTLSAVGMVAPCIIQPLKPNGTGWEQLPPIAQWISMGYPAIAFSHESGLLVISAVEVATDKDQINRGAEYHISISKETPGGKKLRCDGVEAAWVLSQFSLIGAIEDNHVPGGFVRNFWRPVAEPLVGMECACKEDEPAIREDKGDYVWRPA